MKITLMLLLLLGVGLIPACSRDKPLQTAAPPEAAAPAPTAGASASAPAERTPVPAPAPSAVTKPAPPRTSHPQAPALSQPSAQEPTSTSQPPSVRTETRAPARPPKPLWREITLAEGTALPLVLTTAVSSESAAVENVVSARLDQSVSSNDEVVLPEGTIFTGTVTDVERSGRVKGRARLALVFNRARLKGAMLPIRTHEVRFEAEATTTEDAAKIGGGAIGGAIVGGILGGGKGAAKGAAIGGAAGAGVVIATRGKEVNLSPGTAITATLAAPLTVTVSVR